MRAAKALAPAVPLDPLIFQDGETRLRAANLRITDLLQQDEPGSQAVEAHPSSDATESLVRRRGPANAVTSEDASETDRVEY